MPSPWGVMEDLETAAIFLDQANHITLRDVQVQCSKAAACVVGLVECVCMPLFISKHHPCEEVCHLSGIKQHSEVVGAMDTFQSQRCANLGVAMPTF